MWWLLVCVWNLCRDAEAPGGVGAGDVDVGDDDGDDVMPLRLVAVFATWLCDF